MASKIGPRGLPPYAYHHLLDVDVNTPQEQISKSYKKKALQVHPDKSSLPDAEEQFKALGIAYSTLKDPKTRRTYELECEHWGNDLNIAIINLAEEVELLDPWAKFVVISIPLCIFSRTISGFGAFRFSRMLSIVSIVSYDVGIYAFALPFAPLSLLWVPVMATIGTMALAPLVCNSWENYVSFAAGAFLAQSTTLISSTFLNGWLMYLFLCNARENLGQCLETLRKLPSSVLPAVAQFVYQTVGYCLTAAAHPVLRLLGYSNISNEKSKAIVSLEEDWILTPYEPPEIAHESDWLLL
jgi:hypothetical protein